MQFTANQIAQIIHGNIEGDPETVITDIAKIEEAKEDSLCFIANAKYEHFLYETKAAVVIIGNDLKLEKQVSATLIRVEDAYAAFAILLEQYQKLTGGIQKTGIEQPSFIHESAVIGKNVYIGAFAYVGKGAIIADDVQIYPQTYIGDRVEIKEKTIIHAGSKIYENCKIGERVIIHSGVVIGSDGFGFAPQADGIYKKVPQTGNVVIEDDVEIGANTTIDRATMGSTLIKKNVKLDNLIQVAHNVVIGENTVIAAQTGISGSSKIGKNCIIGGQVGIVGHIQIADHTKVNAQSGLSKTIKTEGTSWNGSPAFEYKDSLKSQVVFRNLPNLLLKIRELDQEIKKIKH